MYIDANNINDIDKLSAKLHRASPDQKIVIYATVTHLGLMKSSSLLLRTLLNLLNMVRGYYGVYNFIKLVHQTSPEILEEWYSDLTWHLAFGKDTEDKDSVGGFSQREINLLISKIGIMLEQI